MKKISKGIAYQGDIKLEVVNKLPKEATRKTGGNRIIVAHSETGHHHFVDAVQARYYTTNDPLVCYLVAEGAYADLVHDRQVNAHETFRIVGKGTVCKITRQREWTPEGWRVVAD